MDCCYDDIYDSLGKEYSYVISKGSPKPIYLEKGNLISSDETCSIYAFSLLSDRHIPNSEAKFIIEKKEYQGVVNYSYGREIEVTISNFFNPVVEFAEMIIDSSILLKKLINLYKKANEEPNDIVRELDYLHENIPEELSDYQCGQNLAIEKAMSLDSKVTVIWGPPGTGKTWTLGKIAYNLLCAGKRTLIVSLSNVSVDAAILSILKHTTDTGILKEKVFRYGYAVDKVLTEHEFLSSHSYVLKNSQEIIEELHILNNKLRSNVTNSEYISLNDRRIKLSNTISNREKVFISGATVVATTVAKACIDNLIADGDWDYVIYDEASMAMIPNIYSIANMAVSKMIILGDFKQLSPISESNQALLQQDIFEYLHINIPQADYVYKHPNMVLLDVQHRMVPQIGDFASSCFYCGLMKSASDNMEKNKTAFMAEPFSNHAFTLVDCSSFYSNTILYSESRINVLSACISVCIALNTVRNNAGCSVGIITPYAQQAFLINSILMDCEDGDKIQCATVHQFQGNEKDIIIFDLVESETVTSVTDVGKLFMSDNVDRLINVSMTRAKAKFIVVANKSFLISNSRKIKGKTIKLVIHASEDNYLANGNIISEMSFDACPDSVMILDNDNRDPFLEERLESACSFEYYNSALCDVKTPEILSEMVKLIAKRGKKAIVYTSPKSKLLGWEPIHSKYMDIEKCDKNAPMDFSVVDNSEFWFGFIPYEYSKNQKKGYSIGVRVKGENSFEILSSVTNMEFLKKYADAKKSNTSDTPMKRYIRKNQCCDKCKQKTVQVKMSSKDHGYFTTCRSCGGNGSIDSEVIVRYFTDNDIRCPICSEILVFNKARQELVCKRDSGHKFPLSDFMEDASREETKSVNQTPEGASIKINPDGTISFLS